MIGRMDVKSHSMFSLVKQFLITAYHIQINGIMQTDGELIMIRIFSILCVLIGSITNFHLKMKVSKFEQKSLMVNGSVRPFGCYQKKVCMGLGIRGVPKWQKWGGGDNFLEIF